LEIINQTLFKFASYPGRINFPGHSLTLIVKGTFDLLQGQNATPSEEQLFPTGDEFFPDDVDMQGSCRYEYDFAHFKPKADLLLSGHCHSPNGKPIPACQVNFQVGAHAKTLNVFGDRCWKRSIGFGTISDPEPFTRMELKYENSFGGKGYKKNPVGKGFSKQETENGKKARFLPNIEDPENMIGSPRSRPEPAGFGPLGRMWEQRFSKMGTYKGKYLKERWPWFAEDFDYEYFNAAPPGIQVEGYLRGDEELYFENLHSEHSRFVSRLPGIRVRCFINKQIDSASEETKFQEISMKLDTLWADMDNTKLVIVWRGFTEVQTEEFEEILHTFIMSESLEGQPASFEKCHEMFLAALTAEEERWAVEPEDLPEEPVIKAPEDEKPEESKKEETPKSVDLKKMIKAQTSAILAKIGIDMDSLPPEAREKVDKDQDRILDKLLETDPEKKMAMEQAEQEAQMSEALSKAGLDIDNLQPLSDKAKKEQLRLFAELGVDDPVLMKSPEIATLFSIMGAVIPKMGMDPENLDPFIEEAKKQQEKMKKQMGIEDDEEPAEEEKPSILTREIVQERAARNDSFEGEDLRGIDLSNLDLKGIDFTGANFSGVSLKNSDLSNTNLTNAILTEADLSKAVLTGAILKGAEIAKGDLTGCIAKNADLTASNLENSILTGADLSNVNLTSTILTGADLTDANITESILKSADLTGANLTKAILKTADLSDADLKNTNLTGTDLSEANLASAVLTESNLENTDLTGANLSGADLKKVNLKEACLKEADFTEADLSESVLNHGILNETIFEKAKMHGAVLEGVEAVDANFSGADLTNAKLSNSDFSGADFSKSILNQADFREAKLEDASVEGAKGLKINFNKADLTRLRASEGCDFTESTFREANGFESIWHDALLKDADFSLSIMQGADFTKAILQNADFSAADMKHTRFMKADMKMAKLLYMNMFEGSFEKANLTSADLSGSNMYGVEFLEAVLDHTKMENANLKMTKLG
jgi:uncharacterized protein YjbI with pentapeptide repeats